MIRKAQSARLATYKLERPAMRTDLLPRIDIARRKCECIFEDSE